MIAYTIRSLLWGSRWVFKVLEMENARERKKNKYNSYQQTCCNLMIHNEWLLDLLSSKRYVLVTQTVLPKSITKYKPWLVVLILHQRATYGMVEWITCISLSFSKQISLHKLLICFYNHIILEAVSHCQENFCGWEERRVTKNRSTGISWREINSFSKLQDGRKKICLPLY